MISLGFGELAASGPPKAVYAGPGSPALYQISFQQKSNPPRRLEDAKTLERKLPRTWCSFASWCLSGEWSFTNAKRASRSVCVVYE